MTAKRRISVDLLTWLAGGVLVVGSFALRKEVVWIGKFPKGWILPMGDWVQGFMNWFIEHFRWLFKTVSWLLEWPLEWIVSLLQWMPWPATVAIFVLLSLIAAGWRLALFTAMALFYVLLIGFWSETMNTLALVFVSVPLSIVAGLFLGIAAFKSSKVNRVVQPCLDLMQTFPTFAYLIPIMLLFGFGSVVGLIASAIYATPPMVRNTILGLQCPVKLVSMKRELEFSLQRSGLRVNA